MHKSYKHGKSSWHRHPADQKLRSQHSVAAHTEGDQSLHEPDVKLPTLLVGSKFSTK